MYSNILHVQKTELCTGITSNKTHAVLLS